MKRSLRLVTAIVMQAPFWFENINRFIGYGSEKPKIVFIGLEEGGAAELGPQISKRVWWPPIIDATQAVDETREAGKTLFDSLNNDTWKWISGVLHAAFKDDENLNKHAWFPYFGSAKSNHLLAELSPLPKPGTKKWPEFYKQSFRKANGKPINNSGPFYTAYFRSEWWRGNAQRQGRLAMLREICSSQNVAAIICYGQRNRFLQMFGEEFHPIHGQPPKQVFEGVFICSDTVKDVRIVPQPSWLNRPQNQHLIPAIKLHLAYTIRAALGLPR